MFDRTIRYLVQRTGKEYTAVYRAIVTVLGALLFLAGWPALVWLSGCAIAASVLPDNMARVSSAAFFVIGTPWVLAAVFWQLWKGKGTPVPLVPTKQFLKNGPYRFVRNPMMMGFFLYLLGWASLYNRMGAFVATLLLTVILTLEIKLIEEKELEARFGDAYRQYKKEVPMFVPKFWKK